MKVLHTDITRYMVSVCCWRVCDMLPEQGVPCLIIKDGYYRVAQFYVWKNDKMVWVIDGHTYDCSAEDIWAALPMEKDICALFN